jgi:hypothetical protein
MMGDDIFDLGIEKEALRGKLWEVDKKMIT